ncbi:hypothetical protein HanXRQr2_Chr11g0476301 [Helianthus annuus]|uniref:Uncharacterized protein n=1 Tax=Helianthus annuus TaxID=4232 RepID=A0A9K3HLW7_HELAN|nr:hypothetical protein HanXRQr2_Chr11g0476301 [Helianthus annuus]KAJ0874006.1 hypothetical protein HanPSC8_Chr11g0459091 [Helianthus annuus]
MSSSNALNYLYLHDYQDIQSSYKNGLINQSHNALICFSFTKATKLSNLLAFYNILFGNALQQDRLRDL